METSGGRFHRSVWILAVGIILAGAVLLFGLWNASGNTATSATAGAAVPRTAGAGQAGIAQSQGRSSGSAGSATGATSGKRAPVRWPEGLPAPREVQQESSAGGVTIEAAWDLEQSTGESIRFDVGMNTHSVDLDKIDLARSSILRDDKGRQVKPAAWDSPLGGHHRSGSLVFSSNDGVPLVEADTRYVELVISGVAGPNERVLRWDLEVGS